MYLLDSAVGESSGEEGDEFFVVVCFVSIDELQRIGRDEALSIILSIKLFKIVFKKTQIFHTLPLCICREHFIVQYTFGQELVLIQH